MNDMGSVGKSVETAYNFANKEYTPILFSYIDGVCHRAIITCYQR